MEVKIQIQTLDLDSISEPLKYILSIIIHYTTNRVTNLGGGINLFISWIGPSTKQNTSNVFMHFGGHLLAICLMITSQANEIETMNSE